MHHPVSQNGRVGVLTRNEIPPDTDTGQTLMVVAGRRAGLPWSAAGVTMPARLLHHAGRSGPR